MYRPENSFRSALDTLEEQVDNIISTHGNPEVIIMGDFNVNYLNRNNEVEQLKSFEQIYQLKQKFREEMVSETDVIPLGLSDHSLIYIVRKGKKNK